MCGFHYCCCLIAGIKSLSRHWCWLETAVTHGALLFYTHDQCPYFLLIIGSLLTLSVAQGNTGIVKRLISWNDRVHVKWGRGRASPINSLAWQRRGEMIVGNFPTRQCVECVGERRGLGGTEWEAQCGSGAHLCVCVWNCALSACSAVLKGCQCLVVSAGSFLSGLLELCQQPEGIQAGLAWRSLRWFTGSPVDEGAANWRRSM